jgi:hypothetical protein
VKIRLQVMGELRGAVSKGAFEIVQELGFEGCGIVFVRLLI